MDEEKTIQFISILQDYPALWKKEERDFMNRDVRRKHFQEIAAKMNVTEEDCKKRLKHLKDKMREVCSKLPKTASGQPAFQAGEEIVRWQYYKPLLFMKDQFIGRQLSGSFLDSSTFDATRQPTDVNAEDDEESLSSQIGDDNSTPRPTTSVTVQKRPHESGAPRPCSSKRLRQTEEFIDIEREKLNSLKLLMKDGEPKDDWRAYVEYLVHDLRLISNPYLKIRVRNDISKIVGDAIHQELDMDGQQSQQQYHQQQKQLSITAALSTAKASPTESTATTRRVTATRARARKRGIFHIRKNVISPLLNSIFFFLNVVSF